MTSPTYRHLTPNGIRVLLEESHTVPIVDVEIVFRTGSLHDPKGRDGTTRMMGRMLRMGTRKIESQEVEETIARLGGRFSVDVSSSYIRVQGSVIKRSAPDFFRFMAKLLREPAFRKTDLARVKRETDADIVATRDNDRTLAARHFRRHLFGKHSYGRSVLGTRPTLAATTRTDVVDAYESHILASNMIIGVAGDMSKEELAALVEESFGDFRDGKPLVEKIGDPKMKKGRHLVLVDKPERTQTQIVIGTLGLRIGDPMHIPMIVANTAFGGTFTSRLMRAIRSERGWSYGASSRIGLDRQREAWYMWTFPAAKDAADCIRLQLELYDAFVREGVTAREVGFSKSYLANSHCFEVDTAPKRLDPHIDVELYDLPHDHFDHYERKVRAVTPDDATRAVEARLSPDDLTIAVVATAADVKDALAKLPRIDSITTLPFDAD